MRATRAAIYTDIAWTFIVLFAGKNRRGGRVARVAVIDVEEVDKEVRGTTEHRTDARDPRDKRKDVTKDEVETDARVMTKETDTVFKSHQEIGKEIRGNRKVQNKTENDAMYFFSSTENKEEMKEDTKNGKRKVGKQEIEKSFPDRKRLLKETGDTGSDTGNDKMIRRQNEKGKTERGRAAETAARMPVETGADSEIEVCETCDVEDKDTESEVRDENAFRDLDAEMTQDPNEFPVETKRTGKRTATGREGPEMSAKRAKVTHDEGQSARLSETRNIFKTIEAGCSNKVEDIETDEKEATEERKRRMQAKKPGRCDIRSALEDKLTGKTNRSETNCRNHSRNAYLMDQRFQCQK